MFRVTCSVLALLPSCLLPSCLLPSCLLPSCLLPSCLLPSCLLPSCPLPSCLLPSCPLPSCFPLYPATSIPKLQLLYAPLSHVVVRPQNPHALHVTRRVVTVRACVANNRASDRPRHTARPLQPGQSARDALARQRGQNDTALGADASAAQELQLSRLVQDRQAANARIADQDVRPAAENQHRNGVAPCHQRQVA